MENSFYEYCYNLVQEKRDEISNRDLRFYAVGRLLRMAGKTDELSDDCKICMKNKHTIKHLCEELDYHINHSKETRKNFEKKSENVMQHLKEKHGLRLPYHYTYYYSFFGMLAGTLLGFIIIYTTGHTEKWFIVLAGWLAGLLTGRIFGNYKDGTLKKKNKQL